MQEAQFDDAIVGAGIIGLAHAYQLARRGRRVVVFERGAQALGASVRNFGMLWPIGQPPGTLHHLALQSRTFWLDVLRDSGLWHEQTGSLHLAYHDDEVEVLREFMVASGPEYDCALWTAAQVRAKSPAVNPEGLQAGLWSAAEICVDPREIIARLPDYLHQRWGVTFHFNCAVTAYEQPIVHAGGKQWKADSLLVCAGDDFQTLYPDALQSLGLVRCKLQMMRSQPYDSDRRIGPMLAAGLTLRHYKAFADCPTLPALSRRFDAEMPQYGRYGIHVLVSQNGQGEVILGDSHVYGDEIDPFDVPEVDALVLNYLNTFLHLPDLQIASRWHGVYAKHPTDPYRIAYPAPGVTAIAGVGGAGMTLSFGLADHVAGQTLGS